VLGLEFFHLRNWRLLLWVEKESGEDLKVKVISPLSSSSSELHPAENRSLLGVPPGIP